MWIILRLSCVKPALERVVYSSKEYTCRHPGRSRLHAEIREASECLKSWWDHGLIKQRPHVPEDPDTDDCEPQDDGDDDCEL
jgi:hypothetical protein